MATVPEEAPLEQGLPPSEGPLGAGVMAGLTGGGAAAAGAGGAGGPVPQYSSPSQRQLDRLTEAEQLDEPRARQLLHERLAEEYVFSRKA